MESTEQILLKESETTEPPENGEVVDADKIVNKETTEEDHKKEEPKDEPEEKTDNVYTVKIDGEDQALTLDQLKNLAAKAGGADERFRELNQYKNELMDFVEKLKTDPVGMLEKLGVDPTKVSQDHLYKQLEYESMSEEQKKNFDLVKENDRLKKEQEERTNKSDEQEVNRMAGELRNQYYGDFADALEKSKLPKTPAIVSRMATKKIAGINKGIDFSAEQLVKLVEKDLVDDFKTIGGDLEADKFKDIFGEDLYKKVREYQAAIVKDPKEGNKSHPGLIQKAAGKTNPKEKTMQDFRDEMASLLQAGD